MCQEEKIHAVICWVPWGASQARKRTDGLGRGGCGGSQGPWERERVLSQQPHAHSACSLVTCAGASLLSCLPLSDEESPWAWSGVLGIKALTGVFLGMRAKLLQPCLTLCDPMDFSLPGSSVHGDSPGKNIGSGCHARLQGIFSTQGLNPGSLHCRWILYHLSHQGNPWILEWIAYPFSRRSSQPRNSCDYVIIIIQLTIDKIFSTCIRLFG